MDAASVGSPHQAQQHAAPKASQGKNDQVEQDVLMADAVGGHADNRASGEKQRGAEQQVSELATLVDSNHHVNGKVPSLSKAKGASGKEQGQAEQRVSELATLVDSGNQVNGKVPSLSTATDQGAEDIWKVLRGLALPCYLNVALAQLIRSQVVAALPLYVMDLGGGPSEVGKIVAAYGLGYFTANVPGGMLLAMSSIRLTLAVATVAFSLAATICLLTTSPWLLYASSFLLGSGSSMSILAQQTLVSSWAPASCRGRALSTMGGVSRMSWALGPFLAALLPSARAVFASQLSCCGLLALALCFVPKPEVKDAGTKDSGGFCAALRSGWRSIALIMVFIGSLQTLRKARELFFALAGRDAGLTDVQVGRLAALSFFLDMAVFPLSGRIMDSRGRRAAGGLSASLQTLGVLFLLGRSSYALTVSACVTGLGNGFSAGLLMTLGSDLSPAGAGRGPFLAVYRSLANSSEFVVPFILGVLAETMGLPVSEVSVVLVGIGGVLWVVCCVPETQPGKLQTRPAGSDSCDAGKQPCRSAAAAKIGSAVS